MLFRSYMGKKKKEHVSFGNKALNKNGIPFGKVNNNYQAQTAPKKMVQQRRMGAK